eukprot:COSAG06_NODE_1307_length_9916_cov_99.462361_10_plen_115_part_00
MQGRGEDWSTWTIADDFSENIDDDRLGGYDDGGRLTPQLSRTHAAPARQLEVQANAVCMTGLMTLHFSEQIMVDMELRSAHLQKLREEKRFNRVTIAPLRAAGAGKTTFFQSAL